MSYFQSVEEQDGIARITFKDNRFYQCNDVPGQFVPSVTTLLNAAPKPRQFYDWLKKHGDDSDTIMMEAAERGSRVHGATEQLDKTGKLKLLDIDGNCPYYQDEINMIYRYIDFRKRYLTTNPIAIEESYASLELGEGGTIDRVWEIEGENWIFDIKTGNMYDYYYMQLAAYKRLYEKFNPLVPIHKVGILHLKSATRTDKDWQGRGWKMETPDKPLDYYMKMFDHVKSVWNYQYGKEKPRNFEFVAEIDLTA